jgi:hypothetical protein
MAVAALETQREAREIAGLERLGHAVEWVNPDAAVATPLPLVATGALALDAPALLKPVLLARMRLGRHSLLLPRFRPGDLAHVLNAPSTIEVLASETAELTWQGDAYRVPGSVLFRTKLHAKRWAALDGRGAQLLAYQPTTAHGQVVLCAASVTTARPGARGEDQRRLLGALIEACTSRTDEEGTVTRPAAVGPISAVDLLKNHADLGPPLLLALLGGATPQDTAGIAETARRLCGVRLAPEKVVAVAAQLTATREEIEMALNQAGWTAFVRRVRQRQSEDTL